MNKCSWDWWGAEMASCAEEDDEPASHPHLRAIGRQGGHQATPQGYHPFSAGGLYESSALYQSLLGEGAAHFFNHGPGAVSACASPPTDSRRAIPTSPPPFVAAHTYPASRPPPPPPPPPARLPRPRLFPPSRPPTAVLLCVRKAFGMDSDEDEYYEDDSEEEEESEESDDDDDDDDDEEEEEEDKAAGEVERGSTTVE
jgi:hypothetical protein